MKLFLNRFILNYLISLSLLLAASTNSTSQMRQIYSDPVGTNNEIQKISFYSPSAGYIASTDFSADWVGFTSDSGRTISKRPITLANVNYNGYSVNLTFGFTIRGVKAFSQDTLIAYGDYGWVPSILYSNNGGLSFLLVYHSQFNPLQLYGPVTDMVFPQNNNIGYAVDADRILKTTDRGLSWSVARTDPGSFFDFIEATDNNNVYTFSTGYNSSKLLKTTNAGSTWQQINVPAPTIFYTNFLTPNKGWLSVRDSNDSLRLYYTSNGGSSWIQKNHATATPFSCRKMKFVNDSTGFAIRGLFDTYKTTDSGKVWQPLPRDNNFSYLNYSYNELYCLNENQLWCGGIKDFLEISTNGGGTPLPKAFFIVDTAGVIPSTTVKLINYSKPGYSYKWIVNNNLISTNYNTTYSHNILSPVDSIELIVSNGSNSDTLKTYQYFVIPNLPVVNSFSPVSGSSGTFVIINGSGFTAATGVKFGGVSATSFTVVSNNLITAIVGSGATGAVTVSNISGAYSLPGFTYFAPPAAVPPVITSFSPTSGPIGTSITINGNNFGTTTGANTVFFGAVKGTVISASASQLVCTVPAGASFEPISILNTTTSLQGRSLKPFNVTYADSSNFTTNSYTHVYNFSNYNNAAIPKHVIGKDLDGDGRPDLVNIASISGDSIVAYRNTTDGTNFSFGPRKNLGIVQSFSSGMFDVNDIDGDGKPDIVSSTNGTEVAVLRNLSTPGNLLFANQLPAFTNSAGNQDVTIADYDNDGRNDIAVAAFSSRIISVIRNTSTPGFLSFAAAVNNNINESPVRVASGDLDGDGKTDVVSYNYGSGSNTNFSCIRNTSTAGTLSFAPKIDFTVPGSSVQCRSVMLADYDNDNKLDVVILNDNNYCIFRNISNTGNIAFAPVISVAISGFPQGSSVSNLSGDMKPDILAGSWSNRNFTLIRNTSTPGNISNDNPVNIEAPYPNNTLPYYTNAADFNLDGKIDIITSASNDKILSIFKNNMGTPVVFNPGNQCAGVTHQRTSDVLGNSYQWQQNTGSGFVNITDNATFNGTQTATLSIANVPLSMNGYLYRCVVNGGSLYSSNFILRINTSLPPSVSITSSATTICYGTPVTFTATGVNTSSITQYNWQVNGVNVGTNSATFISSTLTNNSQVRVFLFNPCANPNSAVSNVITITVNNDPAIVTITTPSTSVCLGSNVTFTANVQNPGTAPAYQWRVNGINAGTNSNAFTTSSLANGDQVSLVVSTAATTCGTNPPVTSNVLTMTVNNPVTPSVTIIASSTTVCQTATANFSAQPVNGGTSPRYQWQVNGVNVGTPNGPFSSFASTTLNNGDQVRVILTSSETCITAPTATSNTITMTIINRVIPAVSISGNTTTVSGQSTTLTAIGINPGNGPVYQWQDSTNSYNWTNIIAQTNPTLIYTPPHTGAKVRCVLTSNATCAIPNFAFSNTLIFTINPVTAINPVPGTDYGINFFPNPVNKTLYIDSLKVSDKWQTIDITALDGKRVLNGINIANRTVVSVDVNLLPAGIYVAVLRNRNNKTAYLKFVKQ